MTWVRYDDAFHRNGKTAEVKADDVAALALHVLCATWTAATPTPGLVSEAAAIAQVGKTKARKWARILVDAGLWHEPGHDCEKCPQIAAGFVFHDWDEYNPVNDDVRKRRSEAGKKGAKARWGDGRPMANAIDSHGKQDGKPMATDGIARGRPDPLPQPQEQKHFGSVIPKPTTPLRVMDSIGLGA